MTLADVTPLVQGDIPWTSWNPKSLSSVSSTGSWRGLITEYGFDLVRTGVKAHIPFPRRWTEIEMSQPKEGFLLQPRDTTREVKKD